MDWKKNSDKKFLRIFKKKPKKTTNLVKTNTVFGNYRLELSITRKEG